MVIGVKVIINVWGRVAVGYGDRLQALNRRFARFDNTSD